MRCGGRQGAANTCLYREPVNASSYDAIRKVGNVFQLILRECLMDDAGDLVVQIIHLRAVKSMEVRAC